MNQEKDKAFRAHVRRLVFAWVALLVLMFTSLATAFVPLGTGNLVAGLAIAAVKAALVIAIFMGLLREQMAVRLAAAFALGLWLVMVGLSGVDYATRPHAPASYQGNGR